VQAALMDETFGFSPVPDDDGWHVRPASQSGRFADLFGEMRVKVEAPDRARLRVMPQPQHRNIGDNAHGGFLLAVVDQSYFVCPATLGIVGVVGGVTVDSATQFPGPVAIGQPMDAIVEVLRETGRMLFVRGLIEQNGTKAVAFSGTIRKASGKVAGN
jgi:acyl-coenzyme A thioesterase PaaI-like protein